MDLFPSFYSEELGASRSSTSDTEGGLELGLSGWKVQALSALKELRSMILKVFICSLSIRQLQVFCEAFQL